MEFLKFFSNTTSQKTKRQLRVAVLIDSELSVVSAAIKVCLVQLHCEHPRLYETSDGNPGNSNDDAAAEPAPHGSR